MSKLKKNLLFVIFLILIMSMVDCEKEGASQGILATNQGIKNLDSGKKAVLEQKEDFTYCLREETYTEKGFIVKFPQLTKTNNPAKSDTINKAIQDNIRVILDSLKREGNDLGALTLKLNYEIAGYGKKVISITYQGDAHFEQADSPINVYYTQNIAIGEAETISLEDIFIIDNFFAERFKKGMYLPYSADLDLEKSGVNVQKVIELQYTNQDLINLFKKAMANYQLTESGVIISIEISRALGDHLEMAINYESIEPNMIKSSPVWKDYLFRAK